jgi:hypothetical protein
MQPSAQGECCGARGEEVNFYVRPAYPEDVPDPVDWDGACSVTTCNFCSTKYSIPCATLATPCCSPVLDAVVGGG